jgi:hypothetical protein
MAAIPNVTVVEAGATPEAPWILTVEPAHADRAVREAVLGGAARDGLGLTAIRSVSSSLDEIYRTALQGAGLAA